MRVVYIDLSEQLKKFSAEDLQRLKIKSPDELDRIDRFSKRNPSWSVIYENPNDNVSPGEVIISVDAVTGDVADHSSQI